MRKKANFLVIVCFAAMTGLLALQAYWIVKYYNITRVNFEKEVNLAFEDAIKKEFSLRCDTIQKLIEDKIMDTAAFELSAKLDLKKENYIYNITARGTEKNKLVGSFSPADINRPYKKSDTALKKLIISRFAQGLREEDLEKHVIFYRTQSLGKFMVKKALDYQFDTTRLRPVFNHYLMARNIEIPYSFMVKREDSTNNISTVNSKITKLYPVITKAFQTYRYTDNQHYVRAMFKNPFSYVLSEIGLILYASFVMIFIISGCMIFILKSLFREKRLSVIKNDFISNITHEFKTPIATVSVAIEALKNQAVLEDKEKTDRYLAYAKNEIERLNLLVDKVMNLAIHDEGISKINKEDVNIDDAIKDLINLHQLANSKAVIIQYQNISSQSHLKADKFQFQHAINNILDNAIKYSTNNISIKITVEKNRNYLVIKLKDNGFGIAEKETLMVFDKFYRVSTGNNHPVKGHGLGLNYVKQIMQQHAGWYKIESKLGNGTTLILGWPL